MLRLHSELPDNATQLNPFTITTLHLAKKLNVGFTDMKRETGHTRQTLKALVGLGLPLQSVGRLSTGFLKLWVGFQSRPWACKRWVVSYENTSLITHYFVFIWVTGEPFGSQEDGQFLIQFWS